MSTHTTADAAIRRAKMARPDLFRALPLSGLSAPEVRAIEAMTAFDILYSGETPEMRSLV